MNKSGISFFSNTLPYEIIQTAKYIRAHALQFFDTLEDDITLDEYSVLDTLMTNPKLCQRDLAKILLKDRAGTGRILNSLEKKSYITRHPDTKNNRLVRRMVVTEKGNHIHKKIADIFTPQIKIIEDLASSANVEEVKKMLRLIKDRISDVLETHI